MRLAIATTEFVTEKSHSGGLSNFSANLARIMRDHGHDIDVFVISETDEQIEWEKGIRVFRVKFDDTKFKNRFESKNKRRIVYRIVGFIYDIWGRSYVINRAIKEENKKYKYDLVHFGNTEILFALCSKKIPHIVRSSGITCLYRNAREWGEEKFDPDNALKNQDVYDRLYHHYIKREKFIISPSNMVADLSVREDNVKAYVVESPFYINYGNLDYSLLAEHKISGKYLLFFGTLSRVKGIHTIADVLYQVLDKYKDISFVFLGRDSEILWKGKYVKASSTLIDMAGEHKDRVIILPATSNKNKVYGVVEKAYAVVTPSRVDNLPNTCIESMSLGKIVIGTRKASFDQLIKDKENGFLMDIDEPDQLIDCINEVMKLDIEDIKRFGDNAKERIRRMSPELFYNNIMEVYNRVKG